jgi:two-component system, OmpR family, sensor kinase
LVINLTSSEKKSFFSFLALYLGSSFLLLFSSLFFYYQNEKTLYLDLIKSNMQNIVSKASNEIIVSHMSNQIFDKNIYLNNPLYKIAFYDKDKNLLFGSLVEPLNKDLGFYIKEDRIKLDSSTVGHLGIWFIALEDFRFKDKILDLKYQIIFIFFTIYSIISLIGFRLARLFLKPIKDERERLNNFIKDTTHELNTPISAIIMSSSSENLSSKQLERIKFSASRISEIYKDLSYLFLEEKIKKTSENLNLKTIIKEQIDGFDPLISRKKLEIKLDLEDFSFYINKDDFIRLFNNLLSNAIKYNNSNGFINISLKNRELIVKDSGIGIDKKDLEDIFKRYFRATNYNGGFGLGLNIVSLICQKYSLKIEINSQINKGSSFKVIFPN